MDSSDIWKIVLVIAMMIFSALFSGTETAFSSVNKLRLKNYEAQGSKKAKKALKLANRFDEVLTAVLIGNNIVNIAASSIATVYFIRHLGDTAHGNQLSKATLLLALEKVCARRADVAEYFPAYEILLDQLRDYRFYADDLVHPSSAAVDIIWEKFQDFALPPGEKEKLLVAEKLHRSSMHRKMHG